jgi:hypothetical protein
MEDICSSETSFDFQQSRRRYIPADRTLLRGKLIKQILKELFIYLLFAACPTIRLDSAILTLGQENGVGAPHGISISAVTFSLLCPNTFLRIATGFNISSGNTNELKKSSRKTGWYHLRKLRDH